MYSPCAHRYEGLLLQVLLCGGCGGRGRRRRRVGPSSGRGLGPGRARALLQVVRPAVRVRHRSRVAERVAGGRVLQLQQILNYKAVYFPRFKDFCVSSENTSFATHSTFGLFFSPPPFSCTTSLYHERVGRWDCTPRFRPGYCTSSPEDGIGNRRNHWEKREREKIYSCLSPLLLSPLRGLLNYTTALCPESSFVPSAITLPDVEEKAAFIQCPGLKGKKWKEGHFQERDAASYGGSYPSAQARPSELSDSSLFPQPTKKGRIFWSSYPISTAGRG